MIAMTHEDTPRHGPHRQSFLLGIGLDCDDGHRRITRGDGFFLEGGSPETHEHMQETVLKVTERLKRKGKALPQASADEIADLVLDEEAARRRKPAPRTR